MPFFVQSRTASILAFLDIDRSSKALRTSASASLVSYYAADIRCLSQVNKTILNSLVAVTSYQPQLSTKLKKRKLLFSGFSISFNLVFGSCCSIELSKWTRQLITALNQNKIITLSIYSKLCCKYFMFNFNFRGRNGWKIGLICFRAG